MEAAQAWYGKGLRFECTGCGRCCTGRHGYVWLSAREAEGLAARLGLSLDEFGVRYLRRVFDRYALLDGPRGDCVFLDGTRCSVYEDRPSQCRSFPWWPTSLESAQSWQETAQVCEGIRDEAPLVPAQEIERASALASDSIVVPGPPEKSSR